MIGDLKFAGPVCLGVGESALDMTEQLTLE